MRRVALALISSLIPVGSLSAQSGTTRLEGTVTDSVHAVPLAGAIVRATRIGTGAETTVTAIADRRGRYRFDRLGPGSYAVGVTSPLLDSLESGGPAMRVAVHPGRTTRLELGTPSRAMLQARACPGAALPDGSGALLGRVTSTETSTARRRAHRRGVERARDRYRRAAGDVRPARRGRHDR